MKKVLASIIAGIMMVAIGCKSLPTTNQMSLLGTASGKTTAYIMNKQVNPTVEVRNGIIDVMNEVQKYIPATNETYTAKWTPIAENFLKSLKDKEGNPLPEATVARIVKDFSYVTTLLDKWVDKKGIRQYTELTDAFTNAFFDAFLTDFKPANSVGFSAAAPFKCEELTEELLSEIIK